MDLDRDFVDATCEAELRLRGFITPRKGTINFPINRDLVGWVGLNMGTRKEFIQVNPFIGVHVVPVMKMVAKFDGKPYKKGTIATLSVHLGELAPDVPTFRFSTRETATAEASRLAETIVDYAVPWFERYTDLTVVLDELLETDWRLGGIPERVAAMMVHLNRSDEAIRYVDMKLDEYNAENSSYLPWFSPFAAAFKDAIASNT